MPSLSQIRDAAVSTLKTTCPTVKRVESFAGELDLDTAKVKNLPEGVSILVAALEAQNHPPLERLEPLGVFTAFVVAKDARKRETREDKALAIAETVTSVVHGNTFGLTGVSPALIRHLVPLFDGELDKINLTVWSVIWQQDLVFDVKEPTP